MAQRLRSRLLFWYVAVSLGALVPTSALLDKWLADEVRLNARRSLGQQARTLAEEVRHQPEGELQRWVKTMAPIAGARVSVIDAGGRVLADSDMSAADLAALENHGQRPEVQEALAGREGIRSGWSKTLRREFLDVAVPVGQPPRMVVRLAVPLEQIERMTGRSQQALGLAGLAVLALVLVIGSIVAGRISRPLVAMTRAATAMTQGDFSAPLPAPPQDELGDLAQALATLRRQIADRIAGLRAEGAKLRTILQAMTEGVALLDEDRLVTANAAFSRLLDQTVEDGMSVARLARPELAALVEEARRQGSPAARELAVGERRLDATVLPLGPPSSQAVVVLFDRTQAHQLDTMRQEFVANASHELRTPVAAILAAAETLDGGADVDPRSRRMFLDMIFRHARRLSQLTNDLLEVSRLTAAHRRSVEAVSVEAVLASVLPAFKLVAGQREIALELALPGALPDLFVERMAVERILNNLLDNAIKYSPDRGRVSIRARERPGLVEISITDQGPGIPAEHLGRLFEPFYRAGGSRTAGGGGVGLGLSIVRNLVDDAGGEVAVESAVGEGSSFFVRLPTAPRDGRRARPQVSP